MPSYDFRLITEKNIWEQFILSRPEANFLQSWNWGVFHERLGKKVFRVGVFTGEQMAGAAECVKEKAKRGTYLTIAGGPLLEWQNAEVVKATFEYLRKLAAQEGCQFIRIRPQEKDSAELRKLVSEVGLQDSPMHLTADLTLQLNLTKTEDELLAEMRKNTRYEVRRAAKEGIVVKTSVDPNQIKDFYEHQVNLAKKHNFVPFNYTFLYEQFRTFVEDNQAILFHSYKDEKLLASAFILFYNGEAVYHYGISTPENDRLPGSYACQWEAIKWAKAQGGRRYNFWGIAPEGHKSHRFAGVSLFKRGFGGEEVPYLPAHDLAVSWSYGLVKMFETVRRKLRKL
jgi:lipid II:glycine glycyltransferase (peptidoglycan interpeptide bridge formation enzyme)